MAWVAGDANESAEFILQGEGRGAINAVSVGGLFGMVDNETDVWLTVDAATVAAHRRTWQGAATKAAGIRTFPSLNLIHHGIRPGIFAFRLLVQPRVQRAFIAQLVAAIEASDVDGLNIDFEPPLPPPNPQHSEPHSPVQPSFADGLAFASFLDALAKAMHALPGRRRLLTVDGGSVAGACWSAGPLDHGKRNHSWDQLPCPWLVRFFNLDAVRAPTLSPPHLILSTTLNAVPNTAPYTTDNADGRCLRAAGVLGARRDDPDGLLHIQRNGDAIHHMDLPEVFPK